MALDQYESDARLAQVTSVTDTDTRQALIASKSLQNRLDQVSEMAQAPIRRRAWPCRPHMGLHHAGPTPLRLSVGHPEAGLQ